MREMAEAAPIRITLRNVEKLLKEAKRLEEKDTLLLGFAVRDLYPNLKEGSPSRNKIRLCVSNNQTETYEQAYHAYRLMTDRYFGAEREEQAKELRTQIENCWRRELQKGKTSWNVEAAFFLGDEELQRALSPSKQVFHEFLEKFQYASSLNDRMEFMTVVTLLAITRGNWDRLPVSWVLPKNDGSLEPEPERGDGWRWLDQAERLFVEGHVQEAFSFLEGRKSIFRDDQDVFRLPLAEQNVFQGKVAYLYARIYRNMRKEEAAFENRYKELTVKIKRCWQRALNYGCREAMMEAAREYFREQPDGVFSPDEEVCRELCQKLIVKGSEDDFCGEVWWMLYQLEEDSQTKEEYLERAADYSYPEAVRMYREKHAVSLVSGLVRSEEESSGIYVVNEENAYASMIEKTAPKTWKKMEEKEGSFQKRNPAELLRYFLISDDADKNLRELLQLLQVMKGEAAGSVHTRGAKPDSAVLADRGEEECVGADSRNRDGMKNGVEFYIRGNEEKMAPLIDTALARMKDWLIPVHILDDEKLAARVLAEHPLFYPIRNLREKESAQLNFVVVGDTECCQWLIREAFWMLTFRNPHVSTRIQVLAPDAKAVVEAVKFHCPGMKYGPGMEYGRSTAESMQKFQGIDPISCAYETGTFLAKVQEIAGTGACYFAIDTGCDRDNGALAIQIRQAVIRKQMEKGNQGADWEPPVVAFRCQDPDLANLSCGTVVLNEDFGNQWFNHYQVIPFGRRDRQYQWDALTGHILDQLSLNAHLQYYLPDSPDEEGWTPDRYRQHYQEALKEYYGRSYNRDASMAVAMSLPYRLYQGFVEGKRMLPSSGKEGRRLNILDPDAFYSEEARMHCVALLQKANWKAASHTRMVEIIVQDSCNRKKEVEEEDLDSELYQCGEWEHNRWNRYMISRQWIPASFDQVRYYYEKGNKRQQLYIGKMHPCITAFRNLKKLEQDWMELSGTEKHFQQTDFSAIQQTEKLLSLHWTREYQKLLDS